MPRYGAIVAQIDVYLVPPSRFHEPRTIYALKTRPEQRLAVVALLNGRPVDLGQVYVPDRGPRGRRSAFGMILYGRVIGRDRACDQRVLIGKGIVMTAALLGRYDLVLPHLLSAMLFAVIHEVVVVDRTTVEKARGSLDLVSRVQAAGDPHDRRDVAEQPELPIGPPGALGYPLCSTFPDYRAPSQVVMGHLPVAHKIGQALDQTHAGELVIVEAEDPVPLALLVEPGEDPLHVARRLYAKDLVGVLIADSLGEVVARGIDGHDDFVGEAAPDPQELLDILGRILRRYTQRELHPRLPTAGDDDS